MRDAWPPRFQSLNLKGNGTWQIKKEIYNSLSINLHSLSDLTEDFLTEFPGTLRPPPSIDASLARAFTNLINAGGECDSRVDGVDKLARHAIWKEGRGKEREREGEKEG